jgi:hypothetical protein
MATLTRQNLSLTGLSNPSYAACAGGGDDFPNDGSNTFVHIKNGSGGALVATFDDTGSTGPTGAQSYNPDVQVSVPAGGEQIIGPFPTGRFGSSVAITYSGVTSLTIAVYKI